MLSDRCLFILPFASPMRLQKFSHFCSRLPFRVFTLESFFLSIFIFYHFFDCPIMHLTIQNSSRTSERLIKIFCWLRKRDNSLVDQEKFLKEENSSVQVSTFNQNGLFRYVMQAMVPGFKRKDKQAQIVFQGDLNQGSFHERAFFIVFLFISFFHHFSISLGSFFNIFFSCSLLFFLWGELNIFWNSNFSDLPSSIRHSNAYNPLENIFCLCPLVQGVILGRGI